MTLSCIQINKIKSSYPYAYSNLLQKILFIFIISAIVKEIKSWSL